MDLLDDTHDPHSPNCEISQHCKKDHTAVDVAVVIRAQGQAPVVVVVDQIEHLNEAEGGDPPLAETTEGAVNNDRTRTPEVVGNLRCQAVVP